MDNYTTLESTIVNMYFDVDKFV